MTGLAIRALVAADWRQHINRQWRFSPARAGAWLLALQLAFGAVALWRLQPASFSVTPGGAGAVIALQALGWSFLSAFLVGRNQLYGTRTLALLHASGAPGLAPVAAAAITGVGRRAWSMLLWSLALGSEAGWAAVPLLWALGLAAGTLGHLAGLLALIAWVRLAPRALGAVWVVVLVLQVIILWYAIYLLFTGLDPAALTRISAPLMAAFALLLGLPGLLMLLWLCALPARLGAAYRDGWLRLMELADGAGRVRRSRWPNARVPGVAGALLAKEWLLLVRNPATWFRLGALLLLAGALLPARGALANIATSHHHLTVLGAGVGAAFFVFGEVIAAGFSAEGPRLGLVAISGAGAGRLLVGKQLALSPYALVTAAATWAVSFTAQDPPLTQAGMAAAALTIGLGQAAIALSGAAWDVSLTQPDEEHEIAALSALMEQVPRGLGGTVGMLLALLWAGGVVWGLAQVPWLPPVLAPAPLLALGAAWRRLRDRLGAGDIR